MVDQIDHDFLGVGLQFYARPQKNTWQFFLLEPTIKWEITVFFARTHLLGEKKKKIDEKNTWQFFLLEPTIKWELSGALRRVGLTWEGEFCKKNCE